MDVTTWTARAQRLARHHGDHAPSQLLATFEHIATTYKRLHRVQVHRLQAIHRNEDRSRP